MAQFEAQIQFQVHDKKGMQMKGRSPKIANLIRAQSTTVALLCL
jgi:hypothetical protein